MNHYKFPVIEHIDQVLEAIDGKPEFIVADRPFGKIINYLITTPTTFNDPDERRQALLRECRGIIFGLDGKVLSRRLHKFFNVGQVEETLPVNLRFDVIHTLYDKLDGSMITPIYLPDRTVAWGTKMGLTDVGNQADKFANLYPQYRWFAFDCVNKGITPIFEWTSRKQMIVLDYPKDELRLLAIRDNVSGEYWSRDRLIQIGTGWQIPICRSQDIQLDSIDGLISGMETVEGIEGYVIRYDDGHMLKVKTPWYVRIHQAKDNLLHEKNVVAMIINEQLDDVKASLLADDLARLEKFENEFVHGLLGVEDMLWIEIDHVQRTFTSRKDFALCNSYTTTMRSIVFKMWDRSREELLPHLKNIILSNCGTQSKVDGIRWLWGGKARWSFAGSEE